MEWISVKEQLPEDNEWVLGLCEGFFSVSDPLCQKPSKHIFEVYFLRSWGWSMVLCLEKDAHITHWMPLPEPPN